MNDVKQRLINTFENDHVKKAQSTTIYNIHFKWEYDSLFNVCSKPNFLAHLKSKYLRPLHNSTIMFANQCFDQIRLFLKEVDAAFWEYLLLSNDASLIVNFYNEMLKLIYSASRTLVNDFLIELIICSNEQTQFMFHQTWYAVPTAFELIVHEFKHNFQVFMLKKLQLINKQHPNLPIIQTMIATYQSQLQNQRSLHARTNKED